MEHLKFREPKLQLRSTVARRHGPRRLTNSTPPIATKTLAAWSGKLSPHKHSYWLTHSATFRKIGAAGRDQGRPSTGRYAAVRKIGSTGARPPVMRHECAEGRGDLTYDVHALRSDHGRAGTGAEHACGGLAVVGEGPAMVLRLESAE